MSWVFVFRERDDLTSAKDLYKVVGKTTETRKGMRLQSVRRAGNFEQTNENYIRLKNQLMISLWKRNEMERIMLNRSFHWDKYIPAWGENYSLVFFYNDHLSLIWFIICDDSAEDNAWDYFLRIQVEQSKNLSFRASRSPFRLRDRL